MGSDHRIVRPAYMLAGREFPEYVIITVREQGRLEHNPRWAWVERAGYIKSGRLMRCK